MITSPRHNKVVLLLIDTPEFSSFWEKYLTVSEVDKAYIKTAITDVYLQHDVTVKLLYSRNSVDVQSLHLFSTVGI